MFFLNTVLDHPVYANKTNDLLAAILAALITAGGG